MQRAIALAAVLAVIPLAACGSDDDDQAAAPAPEASSQPTVAEKAPAPAAKGGLPAPLAQNREEANQLVGGGQEELDRRLDALAGYPVVVNRWASWCPPCREEFPFFQQSAQANEAQVAFIGLNTQEDAPPAGEEFLAELPFPGPSVEDPDGALAQSLGILAVSPSTVFIGADGEVVFTRPGSYATAEDLEADIQQYLLDS